MNKGGKGGWGGKGGKGGEGKEKEFPFRVWNLYGMSQ